MISDTVQFREAELFEASKLAFILERANSARDGELLPISFVNDQNVDALKSRMSRAEAWTYVANHGARVVGFALSHPLIETEGSDAAGDTEHLSLLMVDPDYWGKHIGSRLLDLTIQRALDLGRKYLTLWTREVDNSRARNLYEHKGFTLTGVQRASEYGTQVQYRLEL